MNTVCGFGVNDVNYQVQIKESVVSSTGKEGQRLIWICPFYLVWKNMISRAYSGKYKEKYPTYTGSSVCQEWKYLSTFKSWMETTLFL